MSDVFVTILEETCQILETYRGRDKDHPGLRSEKADVKLDLALPPPQQTPFSSSTTQAQVDLERVMSNLVWLQPFLNAAHVDRNVIRTLCYLSRLVGELQNDPDLRKKLSVFGSQMSATRTTLRLFDDILVLKNSLQYGFGKNEPDKFMAVMGITSNIVDHIFLPLEKISWLSKHKLLTGIDNTKWETASSACWVFTSYLNILKTLRYLLLLERHKDCLDQVTSVSPEKLHCLKTFHLLTLSRACMDFIHAVNTLPPGFLWSSKLKPLLVSFIGTSSSLIGLYLVIYKKWLK